MAKGNNQKETNSSTLDFEAELWAAADKMRGHMAAPEYKHVALGLIARDKQTTGLGHVTGQDLKPLKTVFPTDDALEKFSRVVEPLFQKVYSNLHESRTLAVLRDALLPKLLSGELRVPKLKD